MLLGGAHTCALQGHDFLPYFFKKILFMPHQPEPFLPFKGLGLPSTLCWLPQHLGHILHSVPQSPYQSKRTSCQPTGDTPSLHSSTWVRLGVDMAWAEVEAASSGMHRVIFLFGKLKHGGERSPHLRPQRATPATCHWPLHRSPGPALPGTGWSLTRNRSETQGVD